MQTLFARTFLRQLTENHNFDILISGPDFLRAMTSSYSIQTNQGHQGH